MTATKRPSLRAAQRARQLLCLALALCLVLPACTAKTPQGVAQTKRAIEPAGFPQAVVDPRWDVAAVRYEHGGNSFDYSGTKLMPVLLVLRSKGQEQPQVILEDVRGVAPGEEYLVFSTEEAVRLAAGSKAFSHGAKSAAQSGAVGAVIGGGIGALLGLILGGNANVVWQGAAIGAATGAGIGAVGSLPQAQHELRAAIRADLESHAWQENPVAPGSTRLGYLFFPADVGIESVRILVRTPSGDTSCQVPIASAADYNPQMFKAVPAQAPAPAPEPAASPPPAPKEPDLPQPKRAPRPQTI